MNLKQRRILILAVTLAQVAVFAVLFAWRMAEWSPRGWAGMVFVPALDPSLYEETFPELEVETPGAITWVSSGSPAEAAGITIASFVRSVNGIPVTDIAALQRQARAMRPGDIVTFEIEVGGVPELFEVELTSPFRRLGLMVDMTSGILLGLAFLLIGFLVYWGRPDVPSAYVFYVMSCTAAASFLLFSVYELDLFGLCGLEPFGVSRIIWPVYVALIPIFMVMTNLLFHLALIFPRRRPSIKRTPEWLRWMHTVPFWPFFFLVAATSVLLVSRGVVGTVAVEVVLLLGLFLLGRRFLQRRGEDTLRTALVRQPELVQLILIVGMATLVPALRLLPLPMLAALMLIALGLAFLYFGLIFVIYSVATCAALYRNYKEASVEERQQVYWPLWGMVMTVSGALLVTVITLGLYAITGQPSQDGGIWINIFNKLVYLPIPVSFAFGIGKYRLMQIDSILRKTLVYAGMTGFVLAGYLLLVGGVGLIVVRVAGVESQALTILATLALAAVFVPVKNRLQAFVDRRFQEPAPDPQREMDQALAIQRSLLPGSLPERSGLELSAYWEPARQVAGDYYDVLDLGEKGVGLCIGDIAGKGMPAALLMSSLQASVRSVAPRQRRPSLVCGEVRDIVCQSLAGGKFVTFFYGRLEGDRLVYCNAGHCPPLLVRADGSFESLETGGCAVARLFRGGYEDGEVYLRQGDRLVLFTDGLTEAQDDSGNMLGEEALAALVAEHGALDADALCAKLVDVVRQRTGGEAQDDLTLIVLAVNENLSAE